MPSHLGLRLLQLLEPKMRCLLLRGVHSRFLCRCNGLQECLDRLLEMTRWRLQCHGDRVFTGTLKFAAFVHCDFALHRICQLGRGVRLVVKSAKSATVRGAAWRGGALRPLRESCEARWLLLGMESRPGPSRTAQRGAGVENSGAPMRALSTWPLCRRQLLVGALCSPTNLRRVLCVLCVQG